VTKPSPPVSKIVEAVGRADRGNKPGRQRTAAIGETTLKTQEAQDAQRRGQQFEPKGRKGRGDELSRLIDNALVKLGLNAPNLDVHKAIRGAGAIQEVDPDDLTIYWHTGGRQKTTSFKAFCNRVTRRKAILFPPK
jgi:hypothetical protein